MFLDESGFPDRRESHAVSRNRVSDARRRRACNKTVQIRVFFSPFLSPPRRQFATRYVGDRLELLCIQTGNNNDNNNKPPKCSMVAPTR